jgi:hypothetical protein
VGNVLALIGRLISPLLKCRCSTSSDAANPEFIPPLFRDWVFQAATELARVQHGIDWKT